MVNVIRMDLYRLIRSKSFWVGLAISVVVILFITFTIWFMSTTEFSQMVQATESIGGENVTFVYVSADGQDQGDPVSLIESFNGSDALAYLGNLLLLDGGMLVLPILLVMALFVSAEFETGFIKNVFTTKLGRLSFFFGKALSILIIVALFSVVLAGTALISAAVAGFGLAMPPVLDLLTWSALVILAVWALSMLVSLLAWFFRSKVAAVVVGLLTALGFIGALINAVLSLIPSITFLGQYTIMSSINTLGQGMASLDSGDIVRVICVCAGFLILYSAGSILTLRKKDV